MKNRITKPKRDVVAAAAKKMTAEATGVSTREVQYVLNGDRENQKVVSAYMEIHEGMNLLKKQVELLVPFF